VNNVSSKAARGCSIVHRLWMRRACWRMGSARTRSATCDTRGSDHQPRGLASLRSGLLALRMTMSRTKSLSSASLLSKVLLPLVNSEDCKNRLKDITIPEMDWGLSRGDCTNSDNFPPLTPSYAKQQIPTYEEQDNPCIISCE